MHPDRGQERVGLGSGSAHLGLCLDVPEFPLRISVYVEAGRWLGARFLAREGIGRKFCECAGAHSENGKENESHTLRPQWHLVPSSLTHTSSPVPYRKLSHLSRESLYT